MLLDILLGYISQNYRIRYFKKHAKYLWSEMYIQDSNTRPDVFKPFTTDQDWRFDLKPNHHVFELTLTGETKGAINYAQFEFRPKFIADDGTLIYENILIRKKDHLYAPALNAENAKKLFRTMLANLKNL